MAPIGYHIHAKQWDVIIQLCSDFDGNFAMKVMALVKITHTEKMIGLLIHVQILVISVSESC